MPHPSVTELVADAPNVAAHVAGCEACKRLRDRLHPLAAREARADLTEMPVVDPALYVAREGTTRGGMGKTYVARDRRLGRDVAIKQPLDERDVDDPVVLATLRQRFEREARLTARLDHPAIVAVHEAGRFEGGDVFYAMRQVDGRTLEEALATTTTLAERLALLPHLAVVAEAIAYAHSRGVIHRDLTPRNILIGSFGETVVIDWGLAGLHGEHEALGLPAAELPLTAFGVGTAGYAAPEQRRGERADPRADVFALGATLCHLLEGRVPPESPPYATEARALGAPAPLIAIVERAMARQPSDRFADAGELAAEIRRFAAGQLVASHRYSPRELLRHFLRRYRTPLVVAGAALVILAALSIYYVRGLAAERAATEDARRAAVEEARNAEIALHRQLGVTATLLARDPERRLEALVAAAQAIAPYAGGAGEPPHEARQGLLDALAIGPMATPLDGPRGAIGLVTTTPDGSSLITYGIDHAIRWWNPESGKLEREVATALDRPIFLDTHGTALVVCGFDAFAELHAPIGTPPRRIPLDAPDGRCALAADGTAVVASGRRLTTLGPTTISLELPAQITAFALPADRDPSTIAIGTLDGSLAVRRAGAMYAVPAHPGGTRSVAFVGEHLISGGSDGRALRWRLDRELRDPEVVLSIPTGEVFVMPHGEGEALAMLPRTRTDQREVGAALIGDTTRTYELRVVRDALGDRSILGGGTGARPRWVDAATGRDLIDLPAPGPLLGAIARIGSRLIVTTPIGSALIWDLRSGSAAGHWLGHTGAITGVVDRWSSSLDGTLRRWPDGRVYQLGAEVVGIVAGPPGRVAAITADGRVRVVGDALGAAVELEVEGGSQPIVAWSGDRLAIASHDGRVEIWDVTVRKQTAGFIVRAGERGHHLTAIAWSIDGTRLALGAIDGSLAIVTTTGETLRSGSTISTDGVAALRFRAGGALVVGFAGPQTLVVDGVTLATRETLEGRWHPEASTERELVTSTIDGRILIHDGGRPRIRSGHLRAIARALRSPSGEVISLDHGGGVRLWIDDQKSLRLDIEGLGELTELGFADGDLVAGGTRGALRIIPLDAGRAFARACARLAIARRSISGCPP